MKFLLRLALLCVALACALILAIPFALSTDYVQGMILKAVNRRLPGELAVESWNLSLVGQQQLQNLHYKDPDYRLSVDALSLTIDRSLLQLLRGEHVIPLVVDGKLVVDDPQAGPVELRELHAELQVEASGRKIVGELRGTPHFRGRDGSMLVQGSLENGMQHLDVTVSSFPVALLVAVTRRDDLKPLFGQTLDLKAGALLHKGQGSVSVTIDSVFSRWDLNAAVIDGVMTLNEPFRAELEVTPELSRSLLKNINPLLITALSAPEPIRITVDPDGFEVPLLPLELDRKRLKHMRMDRGVIEFGKVVVGNGGPVALIVGIFQSSDVSSSRTMETWFTPQYMTLKDGQLSLERMDILIHRSFHIGTWGTVDLLRDRVDLTLGISADTLSKRFGIRDLDPNYMLQTPLRGTTTAVNMDIAQTIARIATLRASASSQEESRLLGALLQVVTGQGADDPPAPAPTTKPFPWER